MAKIPTVWTPADDKQPTSWESADDKVAIDWTPTYGSATYDMESATYDDLRYTYDQTQQVSKTPTEWSPA